MKSKGHHPSSQVIGLLEAGTQDWPVAAAEWALSAYGTSSTVLCPFYLQPPHQRDEDNNSVYPAEM